MPSKVSRIAVQSWVYGPLVAVLGVATATGLFWLIRDFLGKGHAALLYLPVVVLVASVGGSRAGLTAAVLAFLAWDFFFLPPYYTFVISDPKDWLSLFVFLMVGLAMGLQTGRMREREAEAVARGQEAALLYRLSAHLASRATTADMAAVLLEEVVEAVEARTAILFLPDADGHLQVAHASGSAEDAADGPLLRRAEWSFEQIKAVGLPAESDPSARGSAPWPASAGADLPSASVQGDAPREAAVFLPLQGSTAVEGVLFVGPRRGGSDYASREARLLVPISQLAATFLERQRLQDVASQADALREADRLKSTLMSSVSHELKTPIASLKATVTNLLERDVAWESDALRGELESVDRDLVRLDESIGDLLDLSRLEAGAWAPKRGRHEIGEILGTVLSRLAPAQRERVTLDLPDDLPEPFVDYLQIARAVQNLVENALLYSRPGKPVCIGARARPGELRVWVEDQGPGVLPEERTRIFEKFYRGRASAAAPSGTGLGLAIAAEIARFHGGRIRVEDAQPIGARFVIVLPLGAAEEGNAA